MSVTELDNPAPASTPAGAVPAPACETSTPARERSAPARETSTPARATPPRRSRLSRRRRWCVGLLVCLFASLFAAKLANYMFPEQIRFASIGRFITRIHDGAESWYQNNPALHSCPSGQRMWRVTGGYVCAPREAGGGGVADIEARIFERSPLDGGVREAIYASTREGIVSEGQDLERGIVDIPRYRAVAVSASDRWDADPYNSVYWRFDYYSLRPTVGLLSAFEKTGRRKYAKALIAFDESFFAAEGTSPWAWADDHAVAFRAMTLVYEWWELRRVHALTLSQSAQFLQEITKTANFLLNRNHYQPEMNHGTNESAALYEMAVDFPSLPGASTWLQVARQRLAESLNLLIDADGQLIENSPYYHFYELDKYWQIYRFSLHVHLPISPEFRSRISAMVNFATYILQPNGSVPLLGSSLAETLHDHGIYQEIADDYPELKYVLTEGASGRRPRDVSKFFSASDESVMRSGWGKSSTYLNQAYLTFNIGKYRTDHSHLDALGFTLYDNGKTLLPAPGLYTYAYNRMRSYFQGTSAHNTVVVDGQDQERGDGYAGPLATRDGVTYQSGQASLYPGVNQERTLMMVDKNHFLVFDRLYSNKPHTYQQMFHLFPGAQLRRSGLTASGSDSSPSHTLTVTQLDPRGISLKATINQHNPPSGLCSEQYQIALGCWALAYAQRGTDASYTTLLSVGRADPRFSITYDRTRQNLVVHDHGRVVRISLGQSIPRAQVVHATHPVAPVAHPTPLPGSDGLANWHAQGNGQEHVVSAADDGGAKVLAVSAGAGKAVAITDRHVRANLSASNLQVRLKVSNAGRLSGLTLTLSNNDFESAASTELLDSYSPRYSGGWMTVSLGRGTPVKDALLRNGAWKLRGASFSWGAVDGARLTARALPGRGPQPVVELQSMSSIPQQRSGAVAFIFDDGYESILAAASVMHSMGMPGTVAVIGKAADVPMFNYLNLYELHMLQDQWGWNVASHTQDHVDAVGNYAPRGAYGAYESDLIEGSLFLQGAGLDSAPDWLIYPHGTTNDALDRVVSRFYTFARTTDSAPEAFPFGSPLRVKTLELHTPGDKGESNASAILTPPSEVLAAARDALTYHTTLLITMHRISAIPGDRPGYPIGPFTQILRGLKRMRAPVLTLSELDRMNGVPETAQISVRPAVPSLITAAVSVSGGSAEDTPAWAWLALAAGIVATAIGGLRIRRVRQGRARRIDAEDEEAESELAGVLE